MLDLFTGITIGFLATFAFIFWAAARAASLSDQRKVEDAPAKPRVTPITPKPKFSPKNALLREAVLEGDTELLRANLSHVERPEDISVKLFCAHLAVVVADATKLPVADVRAELEKVYD